MDREPNGDLTVSRSVQIVGVSGTSSHSQSSRFTPAGVVTRVERR